MHYADSDSDIHRIGSPYGDILLGCRMVLSVTAEHYAICACHFYNLVYVNLLVYRVSFFCAFLQQSACRFAFFFGYESFCFIYSFRLDTVLDSLTLRHGSAESLCWRVSLDLPFLSLRRQNKGTTLIVSFQCVCHVSVIFFVVFFFKRRLLFCWGRGFWNETRRVLTGLCDQLWRRLQSGLHL